MYKSASLLSIGADAKTVKGETFGFLTGILYLAPATTTKWNTCPMAVIAQCAKACLFTAGRGAMSNVAQGRINKTVWFFEERHTFMLQLSANIKALIAKAAKQGKAPLIRLNGTSDIRWENVGFTDVDGTVYDNIMQAFPDVQFYDYTKDCNRRNLPANYDLTFSDSGVEAYQKYVNVAVSNGMRIATVFRDVASIPTMHRGMAVIGGDNSDIRHLEDKGVVVALYAKGKAKLDDTGFVFDTPRKVINIAVAA